LNKVLDRDEYDLVADGTGDCILVRVRTLGVEDPSAVVGAVGGLSVRDDFLGVTSLDWEMAPASGENSLRPRLRPEGGVAATLNGELSFAFVAFFGVASNTSASSRLSTRETDDGMDDADFLDCWTA
jgi:hypothetical protein